MSTRCQIKIISDDETTNKIFIYKHSDGYPQDVIPTLAPFVKRFMANRGFDEAYLLCQIVRVFAVRDFKDGIEDKNFGPKNGENFSCNSDYTGWGLDTVKHGDIDYLYEIDSKGDIFINGKKLTEIEFKKYTKKQGINK